jgi:glutamate-ammonia-ligase adenylyltransferase
MLTRLRLVAGDERVGREFAAIVEPRVFRDPMPEPWPDAIRAMKRRIEQERVADAERDRHLKLGPGGLCDIEFLVQYLQLRHGGRDPSVRTPVMSDAIRLLERRGLLSAADARTVRLGMEWLTRLRQSLSLQHAEGAADVIPDCPADGGAACAAATLAALCGVRDAAALVRRHRHITTRVRDVYRRVVGVAGMEGGPALAPSRRTGAPQDTTPAL